MSSWTEDSGYVRNRSSSPVLRVLDHSPDCECALCESVLDEGENPLNRMSRLIKTMPSFHKVSIEETYCAGLTVSRNRLSSSMTVMMMYQRPCKTLKYRNYIPAGFGKKLMYLCARSRSISRRFASCCRKQKCFLTQISSNI